MTLSQNSILLLNQLPSLGELESFGQTERDLLKDTFSKILRSGDTYSIGDIEEWIENQSCLKSSLGERIVNIAHYEKAKHEAQNRLRMTTDSCGCGGNC